MDKKDLDEKTVKPQADSQVDTVPQEDAQVETKTQKPAKLLSEESLPQVKSDSKVTKEASGVSWGVLFNLIFILLLTFATFSGGYYLYQEFTAQKGQALALSAELKQVLNEPNQKISQLTRDQKSLISTTQTSLEKLTNDQEQLSQRIAKLALRNPNNWMAEEAKYLVRMAGNKLWLENDPSTSASLLKSADARIESMKDPSLTPLRKALAKDIATVASIKSTDISGTVLTLDSMIEQLHKLPLNRVEVANSVNRADKPEMTESIGDWKENLAKSWQSLMDDFVVIRKRTTDITPILAPDQQWYLVENIRNKLLQSQLALYRQDQVNYRQSLILASKWIHQYFDLNDVQTQETLAALKALKTLEIQPPTIDHFQSTALLQQLVVHGNLLASEDISL